MRGQQRKIGSHAEVNRSPCLSAGALATIQRRSIQQRADTHQSERLYAQERNVLWRSQQIGAAEFMRVVLHGKGEAGILVGKPRIAVAGLVSKPGMIDMTEGCLPANRICRRHLD